MEKYMNAVSLVFGVVGGFCAGFLGGFDTIIRTLAFLVVVDFITGMVKAWHLKEISSEIGFIGLVKKVFIFLVVAVAVQLEQVVGNVIPLREIVIMFYIANEGISFLENISEFIPLPDQIRDVFLQIRSKEEIQKKVDPADQENNIQ